MPAAAARERSRTTPSSTASSWCAAPTKRPRLPEPDRQVAGHDPNRPRRADRVPGAGRAGCDIARELYLGIVVDRGSAGPVLMVSSEGGMNIEDVADNTPELIYRERFSPTAGLESFQARKLAAKLGLKGPSVASAEKFMKGLCRVFVTAIAAWPRSIRWSSPAPAI